MRLWGNLFTFLVLVSPLGNAQNSKGLFYIDNTLVAMDRGNAGLSVQLPMKCGPDGLVYVRFAGADLEPAITLIKEDGKVVSVIRLSQIPDFSESDLYDFAPTNGEVIILSGKGRPHIPTTYYVSRFRTDGTYISSAKVDLGFRPDFEPRQIAAFASGDLLIAGMTIGHDVPYVPFVGIFKDNGQFLREVTLKDDVSYRNAQPTGSDAKFTVAQRIRNLLDVTFLQTSDDGNVYLTRHTGTGPVFVVTSGGSVRRMVLTPPVKGADLQWTIAGGGSIVAQYRLEDGRIPKTHYLVVMDVGTNKNRATVRYVQDYEKNGGGVACYRNGVFTFIAGAPNHGLQLVRATAQ
jgi:hypothetical protein